MSQTASFATGHARVRTHSDTHAQAPTREAWAGVVVNHSVKQRCPLLTFRSPWNRLTDEMLQSRVATYRRIRRRRLAKGYSEYERHAGSKQDQKKKKRPTVLQYALQYESTHKVTCDDDATLRLEFTTHLTSNGSSVCCLESGGTYGMEGMFRTLRMRVRTSVMALSCDRLGEPVGEFRVKLDWAVLPVWQGFFFSSYATIRRRMTRKTDAWDEANPVTSTSTFLRKEVEV